MSSCGKEIYKIVLKNGVVLPSRTIERIFELLNKVANKRLNSLSRLTVFLILILQILSLGSQAHRLPLLHKSGVFWNCPHGVRIFEINSCGISIFVNAVNFSNHLLSRGSTALRLNGLSFNESRRPSKFVICRSFVSWNIKNS